MPSMLRAGMRLASGHVALIRTQRALQVVLECHDPLVQHRIRERAAIEESNDPWLGIKELVQQRRQHGVVDRATPLETILETLHVLRGRMM